MSFSETNHLITFKNVLYNLLIHNTLINCMPEAEHLLLKNCYVCV
jgi:hypothetical protein